MSIVPLFRAIGERDCARITSAFADEIAAGTYSVEQMSPEIVLLVGRYGFPKVIFTLRDGAFDAYATACGSEACGSLGAVLRAMRVEIEARTSTRRRRRTAS
jgi:hypothetical protein